MVRIEIMFSNLLLHKSEVLELQQYKTTDLCVEMIMQVKECHAWTDDLPATFGILETALPTVLETKCYNDHDLPFVEEVKATTMGHLFEHIALDYLCIDKVCAGSPGATFSGHTKWNWEKFPEGSFLVCIEMTPDDQKYLLSALPKTINLTEQILRS